MISVLVFHVKRKHTHSQINDVLCEARSEYINTIFIKYFFECAWPYAAVAASAVTQFVIKEHSKIVLGRALFELK